MYCEKCNKQSPENFKHCAYCGASFTKKKKPQETKKRVSEKPKRVKMTMKNKVLSLIVIAVALALSAIITGSLTGTKPDALVRTFTHAIEKDDKELFFTLFDDYIKGYNKEYLYFDDEVVLTEMTTAMKRSNEFYKNKCGEKFSLSYKVDSVVYLDEAELNDYNDYLTETYGYKKEANKGAKIAFTVFAKGDLGEYKSIYTDVYAIRIGSKWYLSDKPVV